MVADDATGSMCTWRDTLRPSLQAGDLFKALKKDREGALRWNKKCAPHAGMLEPCAVIVPHRPRLS